MSINKFCIPRAPAVFAGRKKFLEDFGKAFFRYNLLIIDGASGIGKTSFALYFAASMEENKKFSDFSSNTGWVRCEEGWTVETLLYELNVFFKSSGEEDFDIYLKNSDFDREASLRALVSVLNKKNYTIFIDDCNVIDSSECLLFLRVLTGYLRKSRIIVISSRKPLLDPLEWLEIYELNLPYLTRKETFEMIKSYLELYSFPSGDDKNLENIYRMLGGHPFLIKSFLGTLLRGDRTLKELLKHISDCKEISEDYIISHQLKGLNKEERDFLEAFSVYRRPVAREGLSRIYPDGNLDEIIKGLQEKFLIELGMDKRYSMAEPVRNFCYSLSGRREGHKICGDYYNELRLTEDTDKLEHGKEAFYHFFQAEDYFMASKVLFNIIHGMYSYLQINELEAKLNKLLPLLDSIPPAFILYRAELLRIKGKKKEAISLLENKLPEIPPEEAGHLLFLLARLYAGAGEWDRSLELADKSIAISKKTGDRVCMIKALSHKGSVYRLKGDNCSALDYYEQCMELNKEPENKMLSLSLEQSVAITLRNEGKPEEALEILEDCLSRAAGMNWTGLKISLSGNLASVFYEMGNYRKALTIWEDNQKLCSEFGWKEARLHCLTGSSLLFEETGEPARALSQYLEALDISREIEDNYMQCLILSRLGELLIRQGDIFKARDFNREALSIASRYSFSSLFSDIKLNAGEIGFLEGKKEELHEVLEEVFISGNSLQLARAYRFKYILDSDFTFRDKAQQELDSLSGSRKRRGERYFLFLDELASRVLSSSARREYLVKMRDREYDANLYEVEKLRERKEDFHIFIDSSRFEVWEKEKGDIKIGNKQSLAGLLFFFVKNAGDFFSAKDLYPVVWGGKYVHSTDVKTVKMSVSRLRKLIEPDSSRPKYLKLSPIRYKTHRKYYFEEDNRFCFIEKIEEKP